MQASEHEYSLLHQCFLCHYWYLLFSSFILLSAPLTSLLFLSNGLCGHYSFITGRSRGAVGPGGATITSSSTTSNTGTTTLPGRGAMEGGRMAASTMTPTPRGANMASTISLSKRLPWRKKVPRKILSPLVSSCKRAVQMLYWRQ